MEVVCPSRLMQLLTVSRMRSWRRRVEITTIMLLLVAFQWETASAVIYFHFYLTKFSTFDASSAAVFLSTSSCTQERQHPKALCFLPPNSNINSTLARMSFFFSQAKMCSYFNAVVALFVCTFWTVGIAEFVCLLFGLHSHAKTLFDKWGRYHLTN